MGSLQPQSALLEIEWSEEFRQRLAQTLGQMSGISCSPQDVCPITNEQEVTGIQLVGPVAEVLWEKGIVPLWTQDFFHESALECFEDCLTISSCELDAIDQRTGKPDEQLIIEALQSLLAKIRLKDGKKIRYSMKYCATDVTKKRMIWIKIGGWSGDPLVCAPAQALSAVVEWLSKGGLVHPSTARPYSNSKSSFAII